MTSLGFAYTSCTVPAKGTPTFTLADDEMEYGVGIHGEPGIRREKILPSKELAQRHCKSCMCLIMMYVNIWQAKASRFTVPLSATT